jgi:hypothetical protein
MKSKIKLNIALKHYSANTILDIDVDEGGAPLNRYWRKRLLDSKIDNCIEFIKDTESVKKITKKEISK